MAGTPRTEPRREADLNGLLRQVDWRFLLRSPETPRLAEIGRRRLATALRLIASDGASSGDADLAVIGYPSRRALAEAVEAIGPGGHVVCLWRLPRPGGSRHAATRLRTAGLEGVHVYWPGPIPFRTPQFWLPLDSPPALRHLLKERPPSSRVKAAMRPLWRAAARAGLLVPLCAIGRVPGGGDAGATGIEAVVPPNEPQVLLTGGRRSINKVVALSFPPGCTEPPAIAKFARVAQADAALDREAAALRTIETQRAELSGVPRLLADGRRGGRRALAESAVLGKPLIGELTPATFGGMASAVSEWLLGLAGGERRPPTQWWQRLVGEPLAAFEQNFGAVAGPGTIAAIRSTLEPIGALPAACEHRDCSPWNVILTASGDPGLLDWESAETDGLPGLDLVYFLANAAFVLDGALEAGRTRESYRRLLDPSTPCGRQAARTTTEHRERLDISTDDFARLRLLAWIVHSRSDFRHLEMAAGGRPSHGALRKAMFFGLVEEELARRTA